MKFLQFALAILLATGPVSMGRAQEPSKRSRTVKVVAPDRVSIPSETSAAKLAVYVSADWLTPRVEVDRVVVILHGIQRNAEGYYAGALKARAAAGLGAASTLIVAPQFLNPDDAQAHGLAADTLVWRSDSWTGGGDAVAPAPISSFAVIDAILTKLADTALLPNLTRVVVAGHSGGGQVVQRYAAVGRGDAALAARGIAVRYVVANPSSYLYFTPDRPGPDGHPARFDAAVCPRYNDWKYGFAAGMPRYADQTSATYEAFYAARDVVYLLGTKDINPNHPLLDRSCMGEAEGPHRFARGHWYIAQMRARLAARYVHSVHDIAGVGHDAGKMFGSACGLAALFDVPGCGAE